MIKEKPDPNTLHLVLDFVEHHYYGIQFINTFMFQGKLKDRRYCYWCYAGFLPQNFDSHSCRGSHFKHFQCDICHELFFNEECYKTHLEEESPGWDCDCCEKDVFRGPDCFQKHLSTNCVAPEQLVEKRCDDCGRKYTERRGHQCRPFIQCGSCEQKFTHDLLLMNHVCYFHNMNQDRKATDQFIQKNVYKDTSTRQRLYFEPHWFYDFETCREPLETVDTGKYRHQVMAWAMKLIVLPSVNDTKWKSLYSKMVEMIMKQLGKLQGLQQDIKWEKVASDHEGLESIYVTGQYLNSFMDLIFGYLKTPKMKPVFWAHNGSKFDGKFVLDYLLNVGNYELAGDCYYHENRLVPTLISGPNETPEYDWQKRKMKRKIGAVCQVSMIGSKALSIKASDVTFRCSWAHLAAPLSKLPKMFGFPDTLRKGEFPYGRLSQHAWGTKHMDGLPPLKEYSPDTKKPEDRKKLIEWWFREQERRNASNNINDQVKEFLPDYDRRHVQNPFEETIPWEFDKELWAYLKADVEVGTKAMYMYHVIALQMQVRKSAEKFLTPLHYSTSPAWAKDIWQYYFMPQDEVSIIKPFQADLIRAGLRGGRTDKRATIVSLTDEAFARGDRIHYYDFKSLYPSVQKCEVHGTYFPAHKGDPFHIVDQNLTNETLKERMANKTGFLKINAKHLKYVTHPTLGRLKDVSGTPKLMFTNEDIVEEVYCWPELEEAIDSGEIQVTKLHEAIVFARTTNTFNDYVDFFFQVKQEAEDSGNEGLRSLAKLLLNSLWGKLGQKSYGTSEWVHTIERERYLQKQFENKVYEYVSCVPKGDAQNHYHYRINPDYNNLRSTAPQIAAHVSAWGRVILHRKVLRHHGQRALYCDTDSAIIYLRKDDDMPFVGDNLGDLTNEVPKILKDGGKTFTGEAYIREAVFVAPKTYALHIQTTCGVNYYKVVCKGFEPSYQNAKEFHFENFKKLVQSKINEDDSVPFLTGAPTLRFESSLSRQNIAPSETYTVKKLAGDYDKGLLHPMDKRLIIPYGPYQPQASFLQELHPTKHYE